MTLPKAGLPMRRCENPACRKRFRPKQPVQKYCSAKCRRRIQHLDHIARYPEERNQLHRLAAWYKENRAEWKRNLSKRQREEAKGKRKNPYPPWLSPTI